MLLPGFVLFGIGCICLFLQHKPREQVVVDRLNEAISNYTEMNIRDDKTCSLKVIDVQMLVTTYLPEYTILADCFYMKIMENISLSRLATECI